MKTQSEIPAHMIRVIPPSDPRLIAIAKRKRDIERKVNARLKRMARIQLEDELREIKNRKRREAYFKRKRGQMI